MAATNGVNGHHGTNGTNGTHKSALVTVDEFTAQEYDYLICGGGTAGLVVAGKNRLDDPLVDTPAYFLQMLGNREYDYAWETIPQVRCNGSIFLLTSLIYFWQPGNKNKVHMVSRGKALGGSSAINYMM